MNEWLGRARAEQLRQWPTIVHLAERVAASDFLDGLILIGSFASDTSDEFSDVDSIVVVAEGAFADAWAERHELQTPDVLYAWDRRPDPELPVGGRKFLTRDVVKIECLIATASSGVRLAEPYVVAVGSSSLGEGFRHVAPIPRSELDDYAHEQREVGAIPEVEDAYSALMKALRAARATEK